MGDLTNTQPPPLPAERRERMEHQSPCLEAEATWAAYGADWRVWEAWATGAGTRLCRLRQRPWRRS